MTLGVLVDAVPRDAVDDAVAACGVREKRSDGKLPAHVITYLTLALWLFPDDDYAEVATKVTGSLDRFGCWDAAWSVPTAVRSPRPGNGWAARCSRSCSNGAVGRSPGRPGWTAAMAALGTARGSFLRRWRLLAIDGFEVDLPDSPRTPPSSATPGPVTTARRSPRPGWSALAECGTHAFLAAEVDAYSVGEKTLAHRLYPRLRADELLTADRGFYSWQAWDTAAATGAALLWRAPTQLDLPVVRVLPDGTYLTVLMEAADPRRPPGADPGRREGRTRPHDLADPDAIDRTGCRWHAGPGHRVRRARPGRQRHRRTDRAAVHHPRPRGADGARADELAAAYHERWEQETGNDQLKTHLRGPGRVLRSRLPDLVHQEIWAYLIVHHAISALIAKASAAADLDPDRISFAKALRLIRRSATGTADIPP